MFVCRGPCLLHARSWLQPSCECTQPCRQMKPWRRWRWGSFGLLFSAASMDVIGKTFMEMRMPLPCIWWMSTVKTCAPLLAACCGGTPQMLAWAFTRRPSPASAATKPQWLVAPSTGVLWKHFPNPLLVRRWRLSSAFAALAALPLCPSWPRKTRLTSPGASRYRPTKKEGCTSWTSPQKRLQTSWAWTLFRNAMTKYLRQAGGWQIAKTLQTGHCPCMAWPSRDLYFAAPRSEVSEGMVTSQCICQRFLKCWNSAFCS